MSLNKDESTESIMKNFKPLEQMVESKEIDRLFKKREKASISAFFCNTCGGRPEKDEGNANRPNRAPKPIR